MGVVHLTTDSQLSAHNTSELEVAWWSSTPLINKRHLPNVFGVAAIYSEDSGQVLHVFETDNLQESLSGMSRVQAEALRRDPNCRVNWKSTDCVESRKRLIREINNRLTGARRTRGRDCAGNDAA